SSMHSSAAARPTSGSAPAPSPSVTLAPSWISRSDFDMVSACASVLATTKSTPLRPAVIMLLTALPPPPPTPNTVMRGLSSVMSGFLRLMVIVLVLLAFPAASPPRPPWGCPSCYSKTVPDPPADAAQRPARSGRTQAQQAASGLPVLHRRHLRVD